MDTEHAKKMMDAFYKAKRIREQLPPLPEGIVPSYINMLDAVSQLSEKGEPVRVSDVAKFRSLPVPGVTRTLKEMEQRGLIRKTADETDRRVVLLALTAAGKRLLEQYVLDYFGSLTQKMPDISNREIDELVRIIDKAGKVYGL